MAGAQADPARALHAALADDSGALDLLLLAALERAPADAEVARHVTRVLRRFDSALGHAPSGEDGAQGALGGALTAAVLGLRLRERATADPGAVEEPKGLRAPGAHVPGVITAGTFHIDGEHVFWDVHDPAKAVVIELRDQRYARLIVQVPDPRATVDLIERATTPRRA